jgi:hypothetical protein
MTTALCFYELDHTTAMSVLQQVQQRCSGLELINHTKEEYDSTHSTDWYEILEYAQGTDRITIVVGYEPHPEAPLMEYFVMVDPHSRMKSESSQLHDMVLPLIEELVNEAKNLRSMQLD